MGNQKWTIQRNWQHRVHKTKENKTKNITQYVLDTTMPIRVDTYLCLVYLCLVYLIYVSPTLSMSRLPSANCLSDFFLPENKQNQRTMILS